MDGFALAPPLVAGVGNVRLGGISGVGMSSAAVAPTPPYFASTPSLAFSHPPFPIPSFSLPSSGPAPLLVPLTLRHSLPSVSPVVSSSSSLSVVFCFFGGGGGAPPFVLILYRMRRLIHPALLSPIPCRIGMAMRIRAVVTLILICPVVRTSLVFFWEVVAFITDLCPVAKPAASSATDSLPWFDDFGNPLSREPCVFLSLVDKLAPRKHEWEDQFAKAAGDKKKAVSVLHKRGDVYRLADFEGYN